jgi:hypothetical protein
MPGLLRGVARTAVIAGTATSVSNRVSRRQGERWQAQEMQQAEELAALKEQGILTDEEFATQKAKILG